jgi:hypothetical protein
METLPQTISRKLGTLCVIVPGLNEGENLIALYDELQRTLGGHHWSLEVLFVDDGSTDNTSRSPAISAISAPLPPGWTLLAAMRWWSWMPTCRTRPRSSWR